jgi:hypothetical protein
LMVFKYELSTIKIIDTVRYTVSRVNSEES